MEEDGHRSVLSSGAGTPEKPRPCLMTTAESLRMQLPSLCPSGHRTVFTQINPGSRMIKTNLAHHLVRALFWDPKNLVWNYCKTRYGNPLGAQVKGGRPGLAGHPVTESTDGLALQEVARPQASTISALPATPLALHCRTFGFLIFCLLDSYFIFLALQIDLSACFSGYMWLIEALIKW